MYVVNAVSLIRTFHLSEQNFEPMNQRGSDKLRMHCICPLYNALWECIVVVYTVYKHFGRSLHIGLLEPTCVQNFRPVYTSSGF